MARGSQTQSISRRKALKTLGAAGAVGLAGCSGNGQGNGNGNSDVRDITFTTAPSDSAAQSAAQGLVAVVNENSDRVDITAQPNDGVRQGMVLLDRGEADFAMTDVRNAYQIVNSTGSYEENPIFQDHDLQRVFQYYELQLNFKAHREAQIETVNDFEGKRIGWGPEAGIVHENLVDALSYAISKDQYTGVETSFGQEPSLLNDRQVDVVTSLRMNQDITPSYEQELNSVVGEENQNYVIWPDNVVEEIQNDDSLVGRYYTKDEIDSPVGWPDVNELWWLVSATHTFTRGDMDSEIVNHILQVMHDNADQLAEYHPITANWADTDFSFWRRGVPDWMTTHEGARTFYQENNISE